MEKSLEDMLHELQLFKCDSIDLCKLEGNSLGEPKWRIRWAPTIGGEKFKFSEPFWGTEGSGIYKDTIEEALEYARECTLKLFKSANNKIRPFDANEYDWRMRGGFNDL